MKKYFEVLHIMLKYKPDKKSEDKWEQLSAIYWGQFFTALLIIIVVLLLMHQLYKLVR